MTFTDRENNLVNFGRFTVYQSLKEMITDGDDLNKIDFDSLVAEMLRDITDQELLRVIDDVVDDKSMDIAHKDWREELR